MPKSKLPLRRSYSRDLPRPVVRVICERVVTGHDGGPAYCWGVLQLKRRPLATGAYSTFCPVCRTRGRVKIEGEWGRRGEGE